MFYLNPEVTKKYTLRQVALVTVCANHRSVMVCDANTGAPMLMSVFTRLRLYFNVLVLIFSQISTCEDSSLPIKHSKKLSHQDF